MKNNLKFYLLIMGLSITLASNSFAQNQKKQMVIDTNNSSFEKEKTADEIAESNDEKSVNKMGKFYLGIDALYQNSILSGSAKNPYNYYENHTSPIAIFAGYDNQDFFKIESYYSKSNEKNQISNSENFSTYDLRTKTLGLDFKPYLTFDKKSQASFYLIFGLNYNKIDIAEFNETKIYGIFGNPVSTKITSHNSTVNKISPTFGLGIEYLFYKNFNLRFQYKRNFVNAKIKNSAVLNEVKLIETLGIGVSHAF